MDNLNCSTPEDAVKIKQRHIEELQATIDNIAETNEILDSMMRKADILNKMNGSKSAELILRFTKKEEVV